MILCTAHDPDLCVINFSALFGNDGVLLYAKLPETKNKQINEIHELVRVYNKRTVKDGLNDCFKDIRNCIRKLSECCAKCPRCYKRRTYPAISRSSTEGTRKISSKNVILHHISAE